MIFPSIFLVGILLFESRCVLVPAAMQCAGFGPWRIVPVVADAAVPRPHEGAL